jgi:hypothetical protein
MVAAMKTGNLLITIWAAACGMLAAHGSDALPAATAAPAPAATPVYATRFAPDDDRRGRWLARESSSWEFAAGPEGTPLYRLVKAGTPGKIRAPFSWSVWQGQKVRGFVATAKARCLRPVTVPGRDVLVVFGWTGPENYHYAHFSAENAAVHNVIMKVAGKDRAPLAHLVKPVPRLLTDGFHSVRVWHDPASGMIRCYADDMETPMMVAQDRNVPEGFVGVGSFDDTADFASFEVLATGPDGGQ